MRQSIKEEVQQTALLVISLPSASVALVLIFGLPCENSLSAVAEEGLMLNETKYMYKRSKRLQLLAVTKSGLEIMHVAAERGTRGFEKSFLTTRQTT